MIRVPVTAAAMNPAVDLRGARGRRRMGVCGGRGGVEGPQRRPMVDAAVSAQERLRRVKQVLLVKKGIRQ